MSDGKERSVPPPATEFIIPAAKAAAKITISCQMLTCFYLSEILPSCRTK
jgi:hypothetical protein